MPVPFLHTNDVAQEQLMHHVSIDCFRTSFVFIHTWLSLFPNFLVHRASPGATQGQFASAS